MSTPAAPPPSELDEEHPITFAFDYDGTWTRDPHAFAEMTEGLRALGHRVIMVTARASGHAEVLDECTPHVDRIIFSPLTPKSVRCRLMGESADIWVDDQPAMIERSR